MAIRMFLEPINKLVSVIKQISEGDLSSKIPMFKTVELRVLAIAVRHLKKNLNVLDNEKKGLLDAKKSLEAKNQAMKDLISKERLMHVKLMKEERFLTIGKLAGSLAHEIKNPLTSFKNIIYFISKTEKFKNENSKEMFCMLTDDIRRINNTLTELLDYSEVKNLNRTQNYVDEVINKIIESTYLPSNISLKMDLKHIVALIDKESFVKIVRHLFANAVDAIYCYGKVDSKLELKIKDTGVGINNDTIKNIYEPLYTTKVKGVGLGLAIVKEIVELHEGVIFVSSKADVGTEFTIYSWCFIVHKDKIKMQNKPSILIVDDEHAISFSLTSILKLEDYEARSASNGKEAIEAIKNNNFDIAFFDIRLPDMNGVELLKAVREFNSSLIVVMMTAYASNDLIQEALQKGAFRCLRKPFEISEVLDLVKKIIEK
jgi:signal transduction histidine kinase/CheY-like chemotaxis protein